MTSTKVRYSFEAYLRTGRLTSLEGVEHKFNPNHDPANGQFTFANGSASAADGSGAKNNSSTDRRPSQRRVGLSPEEYKRQAPALWGDLQGDPNKGLKNNDDVRAAVNAGKQQDHEPEAGAKADVEAPADLRQAILLVAKPTADATLHGSQDFEKTLTFKRDENGQVTIDTIGLPGPQGGRPPGIDRETIAIAHVHYDGMPQEPYGRDESPVKVLNIPSFVIAGQTGKVWEVGRQGDRYVQRSIHNDASTSKWQPYRGR